VGWADRQWGAAEWGGTGPLSTSPVLADSALATDALTRNTRVTSPLNDLASAFDALGAVASSGWSGAAWGGAVWGGAPATLSTPNVILSRSLADLVAAVDALTASTGHNVTRSLADLAATDDVLVPTFVPVNPPSPAIAGGGGSGDLAGWGDAGRNMTSPRRDDPLDLDLIEALWQAGELDDGEYAALTLL
jgi:hypothetical protein